MAVLLYKLIKALEYETANADPELGPVPIPSVDESAVQTGRTEVGEK